MTGRIPQDGKGPEKHKKTRVLTAAFSEMPIEMRAFQSAIGNRQLAI